MTFSPEHTVVRSYLAFNCASCTAKVLVLISRATVVLLPLADRTSRAYGDIAFSHQSTTLEVPSRPPYPIYIREDRLSDLPSTYVSLVTALLGPR